MKTGWRDVSSWSRGDSEEKRAIPKTWELEAGHMRIVVTKMHGCGESWFLRCNEAGFNARELGAISADDAKREAVALVRSRLFAATEALAKESP